METKQDEVIDQLNNQIIRAFENKNRIMAQQAWPVIKDVYERASHQYENILVPINQTVKKRSTSVLI
jgi:preprotein translocase subunit SecA